MKKFQKLSSRIRGGSFLFGLIISCLLSAFFFYKLFLGKVPIPSDTIVGMYYPWRDVQWGDYANGVPFKNFLITDPVRQQFPWRFLAVGELKKGVLPLWNPYSFSGSPLAANVQSGVFYPLNILFLFKDFVDGWSLLILFQPLLAFFFTYLYLSQLGIGGLSSAIGAIAFSYGGFMMSWLEWGSIGHTALWLPFILYCVEKIFANSQKLVWPSLFAIGLICSSFAGHLQTFLYVAIFSAAYAVFKLFASKQPKAKIVLFLLFGVLIWFLATFFYWEKVVEFIRLSARSLDQREWQKDGWFIPWQNLTQFLFPDFFGNPSTLNYWGVWNYGEFIVYIGTIPLVFAFYSLGFLGKKMLRFYFLAFTIFLSFALPSPWAKTIFEKAIPIISLAQPTRLAFLVCFCLSVLSALGFEEWQKSKKNKHMIFLSVFYLLLWGVIFWRPRFLSITAVDAFVSRRNMLLPSLIFIFSMMIIYGGVKLKKFMSLKVAGVILFLVTIFDLFRFSWKYNAFSEKEWLFPETKIISFLRTNLGNYRYMTTDSRMLPPNFSISYGLQTVDGYDPLYLKRYAELIAASERGEPNIDPPFGYNRIITPHNYSNPLYDLMGVKYILSFDNIDSSKYIKIMNEGSSNLYENTGVFPRAFIVYEWLEAKDDKQAVALMMSKNINLRKTAIVRNPLPLFAKNGIGEAKIQAYSPGEVDILVNSSTEGLLILTDSFYPGWKAYIDNKEVGISIVDYNFRGLIVPSGEHLVQYIYES